MKNRQRLLMAALLVALALGTAWAVRGKFGHEQGAAWAGAVGAMAVILVAGRNDWYNKIFSIALAAAVGWGLGGMISYGVVVGYARGNDFVNVCYGLLMLFVIGALYGFLGGGMFGLSLMDSKEFRVKWHSLIAEMTAFGLLTYGLLINQLEWLMTPPRSELWAVCLGASVALAWYVVRHKLDAVLKVAVWSALGAGFGFAAGNFLQVLGAAFHIPFNFWNVMEYAIGFFGGLGMAYSTLTSQWPASNEPPAKRAGLLPMLLLVGLIPFIVWEQSFNAGKLSFIIESGGTDATVFLFQLLAIGAVLLCAVVLLAGYYRQTYSKASVGAIFLLYLGLYTFLSFLRTGIYTHPPEQYLYLVNIAVIMVALPRLKDSFDVREARPRKWLLAAVLSVLILCLMALVLIVSHGELKGHNVRFQL